MEMTINTKANIKVANKIPQLLVDLGYRDRKEKIRLLMFAGKITINTAKSLLDPKNKHKSINFNTLGHICSNLNVDLEDLIELERSETHE
jgi:DNA-binding Xre family transcriptional regulator